MTHCETKTKRCEALSTEAIAPGATRYWCAHRNVEPCCDFHGHSRVIWNDTEDYGLGKETWRGYPVMPDWCPLKIFISKKGG